VLTRYRLCWGKSPRFVVYTLAIAIGAGIPIALDSSGLAWAESHEDHEEGDMTHDGGPKGRGGQGGGDGHTSDGHETDTEDHSDHEGSKGGSGSGDESRGHEGADQQGQRHGGDGAGGQRSGQESGRPVWAQEGIPEVELGRLNVARSPDQVLNRAYAEALGSMTPTLLEFYGNDLDGMIAQLSVNWDEVSLIDSPLQNLALLREAIGGQSVLAARGINPDNDTLMAVFLGTASDKEIPITANTVLALAAILDQPVTAAEAAALAENAERIRIAILTGHG